MTGSPALWHLLCSTAEAISQCTQAGWQLCLSFFLPIITYSKALCGLIRPDPSLNLFQKPLKLLSLRFNIALPPPPLIVLRRSPPPIYRQLHSPGRKWLRWLEGDWPRVQSPRTNPRLRQFLSLGQGDDVEKSRLVAQNSSLIRL